MTKAKRLIRAVHAGIVCWVMNSMIGLLFVSFVPESWVLHDRSRFGLLMHHALPILVSNIVTAIAFAIVVKLLMEYQHKVDLEETAKK